MFKALALVLTLASAAPALAQNAFGHISIPSHNFTVALPGSLHDTMKAMSRALKSIDAADSSKNAANAQAADDFSALAAHAKAFTPDGVSGSAKAKYDQMMDQTVALGRQLAAAFRANDNKKAVQLMDQLNTEKKAGHGEFK